MFNLLISGNDESWNHGSYELDRSRVAIEYTADEISERYKSLDEKTVQELKSFPSLFVIEGERTEARIGYINEIRLRTKTVFFKFEFDQIFQPLPIGTIEAIGSEIDLGKWELSRTHRAIKDEPIFEILERRGYITEEQLKASYALRNPEVTTSSIMATGRRNKNQVFIVHGRDELARLEASDFIRTLGLEPIVLHEQASSGMTIIEKIEHYSNVGFAIVLYTPCDVGHKNGDLNGAYRARQNVVFEHGYLIAKLGRDKVTAVVKDIVETPNDISGVVYVPMDVAGSWKEKLKVEMRNAGYSV